MRGRRRPGSQDRLAGRRPAAARRRPCRGRSTRPARCAGDGRVRRHPVRRPVARRRREVGRDAARHAGHDDQSVAEGLDIDAHPLAALDQAEGHGEPLVVEGLPRWTRRAARHASLQPAPPEDEGRVVVARELLGAVDASVEADVGLLAAGGHRPGLGEAALRRRREEPADPPALAASAQEQPAGEHEEEAGEDEERADHGPAAIGRRAVSCGPWPTSARREQATTRRNRPRDVGRDAIVAVSRFPGPFGSRPTVGCRGWPRSMAGRREGGVCRHRAVHRSSTALALLAGTPLTRAGSGRSGVEQRRRAAVARQRQLAAQQLGRGDDVAVGHAPQRPPGRVEGDGLHLALDEHVRQARASPAPRPAACPSGSSSAARRCGWRARRRRNPYLTTSSASLSQSRPSGSSKTGEARRAVQAPSGPSTRSSARHMRAGSPSGQASRDRRGCRCPRSGRRPRRAEPLPPQR